MSPSRFPTSAGFILGFCSCCSVRDRPELGRGAWGRGREPPTGRGGAGQGGGLPARARCSGAEPGSPRRFLRHVPVVYVDYPGPASLTQIYGTFNRAMLRLIPSLRTYAEPLTAAMVEFYTMSQVRGLSAPSQGRGLC